MLATDCVKMFGRLLIEEAGNLVRLILLPRKQLEPLRVAVSFL